MEGNQMKMREAVVQALHKLQELLVASYEDENLRDDCERLIRSALSAPPRQCDVGTAEEQSDRFANFCDSHSVCSQCPVKSLWNFANDHKPSCGVLWAQMPYEAQEGGTNGVQSAS